MRFIFLLCFIIPYFSFAQNQSKVDSLSYPCYSNGISMTIFQYNSSASINDSTKNPIHIATHGFFIEDDSLFGTEKEVINPYFIPPHITSVLDSTENPFKRSGILLAKDNEPVLIDSQPATLSLSQKISYTLETQANRCNYHNWEKYIKTYENKKDYILICFNTDYQESKSAFVFLFYEEMKNKYSSPQELIERTFIRWKEKYPTIEYKMASF